MGAVCMMQVVMSFHRQRHRSTSENEQQFLHTALSPLPYSPPTNLCLLLTRILQTVAVPRTKTIPSPLFLLSRTLPDHDPPLPRCFPLSPPAHCSPLRTLLCRVSAQLWKMNISSQNRSRYTQDSLLTAGSLPTHYPPPWPPATTASHPLHPRPLPQARLR